MKKQIMNTIYKLSQVYRKLRYQICGLASIQDIKTDQFKRIIEGKISEGWSESCSYNGFDAWIDYGKVKVRKGTKQLIFEWDNWSEGSVEGEIRLIEEMAKELKMKVSYKSRWVID